VTAVGAFWVDARYSFYGSPRSRKVGNVTGGGFTHEYSAPSAGPPPRYVCELTPEHVYAVAPGSPVAQPGGRSREEAKPDEDHDLQAAGWAL
jgi:hypothetical protein